MAKNNKELCEEQEERMLSIEELMESEDINVVNEEDLVSIRADVMLRRDIKEVPMLVEDLIPKNALSALVGSSDTGKSSLLRQLAVCVVTGKDFLLWKVKSEHKQAIYVSSEDSIDAVIALLTKQIEYLGLEGDDLHGLSFVYNTDNLLETLDNMLKEEKRDLILIDAFADVFEGSINDSNSVRNFLNQYSALANRHKVAIVFLHHTNKQSDNLNPSKHSALGSQGFEAKMRSMILLKGNQNDSSIRHLCIVKGNYVSFEYKNKSFDMTFTKNLTFEPTGNTTNFDQLNKRPESQKKKERREKIVELKSQGKNQKEIAQELGISEALVSQTIKSKI